MSDLWELETDGLKGSGEQQPLFSYRTCFGGGLRCESDRAAVR